VFDNAAMLRGLLDDRGIARAVLVGAQPGRGRGAGPGRRLPHPRALVLVAPVGGPGTLDVADRVLAGLVLGPALAWLGFRGLGALLPGGALGAGLLGRVAGIDPTAVVDVLDRLQHGPTWRFCTEQRALVRCFPPLLALLPAVVAPAALLAGRRDRLARPGTALALHRALPGSTLHWVPGGDLIPAYSPTTLAGLVLDAALRTPEGLRRPEGGVR